MRGFTLTRAHEDTIRAWVRSFQTTVYRADVSRLGELSPWVLRKVVPDIRDQIFAERRHRNGRKGNNVPSDTQISDAAVTFLRMNYSASINAGQHRQLAARAAMAAATI